MAWQEAWKKCKVCFTRHLRAGSESDVGETSLYGRWKPVSGFKLDTNDCCEVFFFFETCINQYHQCVFRAGCLSFGTVNISARQFFVVRHCPVHFSRLSSIPGPLLTTCYQHTFPLLWQPKMSPNVTWRRKSLSVQKLLLREIMLRAVCGMDRKKA